ncbi:hypothetical protein, partial [Burkholderia sp. Tr-860]
AAAGEAREDAALGWAPLLGDRLQRVPVAGTHMTVVAMPHVQALGAAITQALGVGVAGVVE